MIRRRLLSSFASSNYRLPQTISQLLVPHIESSNVQGSQQPATITVTGWIKSIRRQKNVSFAVLTDGSSHKGLQAVFVGAGRDSEDVKKLTNGSAVKLTGKLISSPGKGQDKELVIELEGSSNTPGRVELLGECPHDTYPIQKQALSNEYLRDYAHLRARTDRIASMIRLRSALKRNISEWFETQGFHQVHTPILTGNDAEGAGEAFRIAPMQGEHPAAIAAAASSSATSTPTLTSPPPPTDFFSLPAYLTVSHQLHLEALASALSRVYSLSPCFRAEPSLTARHLAEFWMLEAEWAFSASGVEEICMFVEEMLRSIVGGVLGLGGPHRASVGEDISVLWKQNVNGGEDKLTSLKDAITSRTQWTRLTYAEAIKELQNYHNTYTLGSNSSGSTSKSKVRFQFEPNYSKGLQSEHERWVAEHLIGGPVFITDYPLSIKPFYMRLNSHSSSIEKTGEETAACFDLLIPHLGELVGGSVREERLDVLSARMDQAGLGGPEYEWYRDLRRYGGAPHGGFGMGFERLVAWVGGIENVRECVPMPRWPGRMLL